MHTLTRVLAAGATTPQSCPADALETRAVAGIRGRTLVLTLPHGEHAATVALAALLPALPHGLKQLRSVPEPWHPNHTPHAST